MDTLPVENILSEESAQELLDQFTAYYEIDTENLPDALKSAMTYCLSHMKRAIRTGRLEIEVGDETIVIKQNLRKELPGVGKTLTYKEVSGAAKIPMKEDSGNYGKVYTFLGALSGEGVGAIAKLKGADMSLAESLGTVFLQI